MPVLYTPQTPVPIDFARQAEQAGESGAGYFGAFVFGNLLYMVCTVARGGVDHVGVYQSGDLGQTWSELDPANAPAATDANGTPILDGSGTPIGLNPSTVTVAINNVGAIAFADFDLVSSTWGTLYGTAGAPSADQVKTVYLRPDNTLAVLYSRIAHSPDSGLYADFYSIGGGTWAGEIDAGVNITALPGYDATQTDVNNILVSCMGPDGSVYTFFSTFSFISSPQWNNRAFYQRISPLNAVAASSPGDFFDFPGQDTAGTQDLQQPPFGKPTIAGNRIILPISRNNPAFLPSAVPYATLYIGSGLPTVSSWFEATAGIDPTLQNTPTGSCWQIGASTFDGASLYVVYLWFGSANASASAERLCRTDSDLSINPNSFVWTGQTVFDSRDAAFSNPDNIETLSFPSVQRIGQFVLLTVDGEGTIPGNYEAAFWLGDWRLPSSAGSGRFISGAARPHAACSPYIKSSVLTKTDLTAFQRAFEALRPPQLPETRVPTGDLCSRNGRIRTTYGRR